MHRVACNHLHGMGIASHRIASHRIASHHIRMHVPLMYRYHVDMQHVPLVCVHYHVMTDVVVPIWHIRSGDGWDLYMDACGSTSHATKLTQQEVGSSRNSNNSSSNSACICTVGEASMQEACRMHTRQDTTRCAPHSLHTKKHTRDAYCRARYSNMHVESFDGNDVCVFRPFLFPLSDTKSFLMACHPCVCVLLRVSCVMCVCVVCVLSCRRVVVWCRCDMLMRLSRAP